MSALVARIQSVGAGSSLLANPAIKASFTAVGTKGATFTTSCATAEASAQQAKHDEIARASARFAIEAELDSLSTLVANNAATATDISGMGLVPRPTVAQTRTVPNAPAELVSRLSRTHGRARVTVVEPANARWSYVAESTPDPIGASSVWTDLPGTGRSRTLTGATGARVWVRFAQVRYGLQSAWSTPVLVTLP